MEFQFKLGQVLKDKVTGFKGIAMARTEYWTNCNHYGLCSQELKDGKPIEWEWLDETRLEEVETAKKIIKTPRKPTSGPHSNAPQM